MDTQPSVETSGDGCPRHYFTIGIEMLLAADIRIAASNVRFAQLEIARGLYPLGVRATLRSAQLFIDEGEPVAAARISEDMPGILASDDFREGIVSFAERRAANFHSK